METLRFLMVTTFYPPYHLGGDAVHVQYLAEALAAQGHEVHVEYSPAAYGVKRREPPVATDASNRVHVHAMTRLSQASSPLAAYLLGVSRSVSRFHEKLVRDVQSDVIHLHNISLLGLGVLGGSAGKPLLYTAHDYWFRCPRSDLLKGGQSPCTSPTCRSCMVLSRRMPPPWRGTDIAPRMDRVGCVIAPSRFMKNLAGASFRCPVVQIPNFVPDANPSGTVARPSDYLLYAGVLERHKGVLELARAARKHHGRNRFVLVGRGSEEKTLRRLAAQPGSNIEVRPWADRRTLSSLYREAAAFLMPSTCLENAPLSAIEALAWGAPLLTTSRGGVSELVYGGLSGYSFEPSAEGILRAVEDFEALGDSPGLRNGARKAYEMHHQPSQYLAAYRSVVERLLNPVASASGGGPSTADGPRETEGRVVVDARHTR